MQIIPELLHLISHIIISNIHFNIFRPKASTVKLNFFTRYMSLL